MSTKTTNRFSGVNWSDESKSQPVVNSETLTTHICNFGSAQLAKVEQINSFNMAKNMRGFKSRPEPRKSFADVIIKSHSNAACIVINKDDTTAKEMQKLANDAGYKLFYNCKSFADFKEWFQKNLR